MIKQTVKHLGYDISIDTYPEQDGFKLTILLSNGTRFSGFTTEKIFPSDVSTCFPHYSNSAEMMIRQNNENLRASKAYDFTLSNLIFNYEQIERNKNETK